MRNSEEATGSKGDQGRGSQGEAERKHGWDVNQSNRRMKSDF